VATIFKWFDSRGSEQREMATVLEKVNRTKISHEILADILRINTAMQANGLDFVEARIFRIFEFLESRKRPGNVPMLAMAIDLRLTALAKLENDTALRTWLQLHSTMDPISISTEILKAAAVEPLIENTTGDAVFNAENFRRRLLANITPKGRA
jgi:hypothetical protein